MTTSRWLAAVCAAALVALTAAPGASAHAVLIGTTPGNDSVLERSPEVVTLRFNERVETAFGSVRVYDSTARRVDSGDTVALGLGAAGLIAGLAALGMGFRRRRQ